MWRLLLVENLVSVALAANNYGLEGCYESACMNIKTQAEMDAWKKTQSSYSSQFVPAAYQKYATKTQHQKDLDLIAKDPKKDQGKEYMKKYGSVKQGDYEKYMKQYASGSYGQDDPCGAEEGCRNAKTQKELDAWKESAKKNMKNVVPAAFQDYASQDLDDKYKKKTLHLIENPPTKDEADVQDDKKSSHVDHDKSVEKSVSDSSSANFLAQRAEEAGSTSSVLADIKTGVVCFAWAAGVVLLIPLYAKFRKGSQLIMLTRAPEPALVQGYTSL